MTNRAAVGLYALGGTIAASSDGHGGVKPQVDIRTLVQAVPDIESLAHIHPTDITLRPSVELSLADIVRIANRLKKDAGDGMNGFVISQGTDTLEECAYGLDVLLDLDAPVVLTGAMRPAGVAGADGPANLRAAVAVAASPAARRAGVLVVMNDEVHAARYVQKTHTSNLAAFQSPGHGRIGEVIEGRVFMWASPRKVVTITLPDDHPEEQKRVALMRVALGDDERSISFVLEAGYHGLVLEGMGAGHVPSRMVEGLAKLAAQIPVVLTSRTGSGDLLRNTYSFPGAEMDLHDKGLIFASRLDGLKARVLLSLLLMAGADSTQIRTAFEGPTATPERRKVKAGPEHNST